MVLLRPFLLSCLGSLVFAQQSLPLNTSATNATTTQPSNITAPSVTAIVTSIPVIAVSVSRGNTVQVTSFIPTTVLSTIPPHNTSTATSTNATTATTTAMPTQYTGPVLDTRVDPAFGVLGTLLVLTGLPSAFLGHKNRWSSFFLTGFYTFALVCLSLILKFGVLVAIHPPNKTLRGLFVLACGVAGVAGGGVSIFFWQQAKYFIGAWGGFSIGLWIQCFRSGGLIRPIGFRWIMYIGCGAVGFVLCTIPKLHYHVLIMGTAITGASVFMLGVDCFSTAGLKEFYVYNLGFASLFPKFAGIPYPLSQTMAVELGLIAAVAVMGAAVQLRVLKILKRKLAEINAEERRREALAEEKAGRRFEHVQRDLEEWEKDHGKVLLHEKQPSGLSGLPFLVKDPDDPQPSTPGGDSTVVGHRMRTRSGISDLAMNDDPQGTRDQPVSRFSQNPGLLPAMNLGLGLDSELSGKLSEDDRKLLDPDLMKKEELLAEIQTIRKSIDALRSETDSNSGESRHLSTSLRSRTLSGDMALAQAQASSSQLRPAHPRRERVHSIDVLSSFDNRVAEGTSIGRPASTPLRDDDWDAYVRERKLFQPPSGTSVPLAPTLITPTPRPASAFLPVPDAVTDALARRQLRESAFELGVPAKFLEEPPDLGRVTGNSSQFQTADHRAVGPSRTHKRSASGGPVNILPPRPTAKPEPTAAPRTRTFEELVERHQQKIRTLQAPVSKREREQAELAAARNRWERSKAAEKEVMARRRAEKEAALAKKSKEESKRPKGDSSRPNADGTRHSRSLSGDRLGVPGVGSGGKRASMAKVQEWQKYQQEVEKDPTRGHPEAEPNAQGVLPFPNTAQQPAPRGAPTGERRRSRSGIPRDPPS